MSLLAMWLMYTVFGVTFFSLIFLWAVRTRQFTGQDRARYMALEEAPDGTPSTPDFSRARSRPTGVGRTDGGRTDDGRASAAMAVPIGLLLMALLLLGGAGWYIGTR